LYSLVYALLSWSLLGELEKISDIERKKLVDKLDSFQTESGIFSEEITQESDGKDWWGPRHLSLHVIAAYAALNAQPKNSFTFLEEFEGVSGVDNLFKGVDWTDPNILNSDFDNKVMNIGGLLQYKRDMFASEVASDTLLILKSELLKGVNPETGLFGMFEDKNSEMLSRMVQFTYHIYNLFWFDEDDIPHVPILIEKVLKTQNVLGGYGPKMNTSACEDIDSIDLLTRLANREPNYRNRINKSLARALKWVASNQVKDGGFVFRRFEAYQYGHKQLISETESGSMFATWFRLLSIALISNSMGNPRYKFVECPGYQFTNIQGEQ
jgi:hypothetical protein